MMGTDVAARGSVKGMLKARAIQTVHTYIVAGQQWVSAADIIKGCGIAPDAVARRTSLLSSLGKWAGVYAVSTPRHLGPWPGKWRLLKRMQHQGGRYVYTLTAHGSKWNDKTLCRIEAGAGLAPGAVADYVSENLRVVVAWDGPDRRALTGEWYTWAISRDTEAGCWRVSRGSEEYEGSEDLDLDGDPGLVILADNTRDAMAKLTQLGIRLPEWATRILEGGTN